MNDLFLYFADSKDYYIGFAAYICLSTLLAFIARAQDAHSFKDGSMGVVGLIGIVGFIWIWRVTDWTLGVPALISFIIVALIFDKVADSKLYRKTEEQKAEEREEADHKRSVKEKIGMAWCAVAMLIFIVLCISSSLIIAFVIGGILFAIAIPFLPKSSIESDDPTRKNWKYWDEANYMIAPSTESMKELLERDFEYTKEYLYGYNKIGEEVQKKYKKMVTDMFENALAIMQMLPEQRMNTDNDDYSITIGDLKIQELHPRQGDNGVIHRRTIIRLGTAKMMYHFAENGPLEMFWWDYRDDYENFELNSTHGRVILGSW